MLQHYTQQNGLPQNSITDLIWDQNHLLWITTEDGLVRFNGNQFNTFNQTNSSCIKNDRFKWILKDALGNLNACDAEGNVYPILNYSPTQCKFMYTYRYLSGYFPDTATLQVILNHPTFKRKGSNLVIFQCKTKNQLYVKQLNTIYTVRNNSFIDSLILPPKTVDCFSLNGNIYIYSKDTLYNLNLDNKSVKKVNLPIRFRISENNKFYAQNGNQSVILKQGKQLFVLTTKNSSTEMNITHQAIVKGNLEGYLQKVLFDSIINTYAISTNLNGLYILRPSYFKTQSNNKIDEQNEGFYAQLHWDDSSVLTSFGEIISYNAWLSQIQFRFKQINKKAFLKDDDGYFWMLRHDSVLIADSWWKNVVAIPTGGIHAVGTFAKWKTDVLLITEQEIMLFSKRKLKRKIPLLRAAQEKSGDIAVLIENNTLYLGLKNGLYKYDLSKMKIDSVYPCYNSRYITRVGRMILCTTYGNGLFAMVDDSLIPLPLDNYGYLSKAHNAVVVDSTGFILFATNNGFFTTYSSEIENYLNLKSNSIYYQYFDRQDGILNTEFNGGCYPSFNILQPDLVSFSNMLGIVFVKPSKLKLAPLPNLHYVNSVRIDGMLLNVNQDSISVPSSFNSLSLTIGSAYWNNPTNIQIAYRLNESTVWNALERHDNAIVFTHLNAGNNLIQIQIRTGFNLYHTLNITVYREPAFFEQVWFKICVIILGILLLLLIGYLYNNRLVKYNAVLEAKVEARTQQLKDMNMFLEKSKQELQQSVNVKNKLISIISHDIVTPIKFISMVSKNYNKKEHPDN
ncbi:MAG: hypothetical protein MUE96_08150, partial [Bacteroidia bacterium]|nr:hypothetical protein [Bacteroidia bacterium]